jgi:hypothetical protein
LCQFMQQFQCVARNSLFFAEQGIFSRGTGNFLERTGNFSTEQGISSPPIGFMETICEGAAHAGKGSFRSPHGP